MRPVQTIQFLEELDGYSEIIDVRSPDEFALDRMPGSINCYVLNNEERIEVGTMYKQVSPFEARKRGAALIYANISRWMKTYFVDKPVDYRPLVYCWRGGQRSMSLALLLSHIGWETAIFDGGYKHYRKLVREGIDEKAQQLKLIKLTGFTGTAKTDLLKRLKRFGKQVIDLEGLANHRGSILGFNPDSAQPSQKYFESLLNQQLQSFDLTQSVWLEAESNKIGNLHCPDALWQQMKQAKGVEIQVPFKARTDYLMQKYQYLTGQAELMKTKISGLVNRHGKAQISEWLEMIDAGNWQAFNTSLLQLHYDPAYRSSSEKNGQVAERQVQLEVLDDHALDQAADQLLKLERL